MADSKNQVQNINISQGNTSATSNHNHLRTSKHKIMVENHTTRKKWIETKLQ